MAWEMVLKYEPPHKCDTPRYYDWVKADIGEGDTIRCDCGQHWKCIKALHESDQREGSSWTTLEYVKVPDPAEVVYPQGFAISYPPGVR